MANVDVMKHYWLYVLKLEQEKYYIGITSRKDPHDRIKEHLNGYYSAQWVKKYPALETVEIIDIGNITPLEAARSELKRTRQYMKKYGLQNVRGGALNYSGKYYKVGYWYWRDEDFSTLLTVIVLLGVIAILLMKAM